MLIAQAVNGSESGGVSAGERGDAGENFIGRGGRLLVEVDERVTEQGENTGTRVGGSSAECGFIFVREQEMLAEFEKHGAEVVFDLNAVEIHGNGEAGDDVRTEEDAAILSHVEKFNGENVRGGGEFRCGEEERRRFVLVFAPPLDGGSDAGQLARGERAENAHDVEVGVRFVKVATGSGAVKDDGFEIIGCEFLEAANQIRQFFIV